MAGGTWVAQNKVRPGVYMNFISEGGALGAVGDRGVTAMALKLPWGPAKTIVPIHAGDKLTDLLGYDISAPELLLVREALKRASTLLLYRLNAGTPAAATIGSLTATAKHGGTRGNDLTVLVQTNVDDASKFDVVTMLSGKAVDTQAGVKAAEDLKPSDWVVWSGTGALTTSAGAPLTGGADGNAANADHADFLAALELQDFQTVALASTDNTLKGVYAAYIRRLRDEEGKKVQAVLENYPTADHEGIISVKNGVVLSDGTTLTAAQATVWTAAATAAATIADSLTYQGYDDATDAAPRYTNSQIIEALNAGEFLFTASGGKAIVEQDINSLTSLTPEKGAAFRKNRVIRVLDGIANDIKRIFESYYIGKVGNDGDGRNLLKGEIINYLDSLQNAGAIQNFDSQKDLSVVAGSASDSVYIELNVQPVDAVEKIYMKVTVK